MGAGAVAADPLPIGDPSFDARPLEPAQFTTNISPWREAGRVNSNGFLEHVPGFAADGQNHLGMNPGHDVWQDLGVSYEPKTRYTLTVAVGNRITHTQNGNESRYLLATGDGTVFATGTFNASTVSGNSFVDAPPLEFEPNARSSAIGKPIRILLEARGPGRSHFDNIRLTAVSTKLPQTIAFDGLPALTEGDPPITLSASASSDLPVSYASSDPAIASVDGNLLTAHGPGAITITASQAGNDTFLAAPPVSRALVIYRIERVPQTIDFPQTPIQTLGNRPFALVASASSGLPVAFSSSDPEIAVVSGDTVTPTGAGSVVITASQSGDPDYLPAPPVQQTVVINPPGDALAISPSPIAITVRSGETATVGLTLDNPTGGQIDWQLLAEDDQGRASGLEGQLDAIIHSGGILNDPLPGRFDFAGGEAGNTGITNTDWVGLPALENGNRLLTNLGGPLTYTDDHVATSPVLGPGGRYFTHKLPGLFVFGAETDGIEWFEVAGTVGIVESKQTDSFRVWHGGRWWSAFVFIRQSAFTNINQLILVDQDDLQQTLSENQSQQQRISGLEGNRRIYQFLYLDVGPELPQRSVFIDLSTRFLDLLPEFVSRISFDPATGSSPALDGAATTARFDAAGLPEGTYQGMVLSQSPAGDGLASAPLSVTVTAPRLEVPASVEREMLPGQAPQTLEIPLISDLAEALPWTAELETAVDWLGVTTPAGTTPEPLKLHFNPDGLDFGPHMAVVRVTSGTVIHHVVVNLRIIEPAISKFVADPGRPRVYGIHKNGPDEGALLVFDSISRRILHSIPIGKDPTGCDVSEDGSKIWVLNAKDPSLMAVSTDTWSVAETIPLTEFTNRSRSAANPGPGVKTGKGDIVYYVDEQWGPRLRVFNTASRTVLQTLGAESGISPNTSNNYGFGDIGVDRARTRLFGWRQYGDSAGVGGSHIVRFDIAPDGTLGNFTRSADYNSANFDRSPYDTPVLISDDGSRVFIKDREVDPGNPDAFPLVFPKPLYSLAGNGTVVASATAIHSTKGARQLALLPVTTSVQTILPDLSALVYFDSATRTIGWLDLPTMLGGEALALNVSPADGSVVTTPSRLEWPGLTGIGRYRVYLGETEALVNAATPGSPGDLGETTETWIDLPSPPAIGRHFWRVVPLDADGNPVADGTTRSFTVASLAIHPASIKTATISGNPNHRETIGLDSAVETAWSATANTPWIRFENAAGTTPDGLEFVIDASALPPGEHTGSIRVTSGGFTTVIPVTLTLHTPNYTMARADLELPRIYAISEGTETDQPAFLVVLDPESGGILRTVPVGTSVTGMSVHYTDNRIYMTNRRDGLLRAIDRDSLEEVRVYPLASSDGVGSTGGDSFMVSTGRADRLVLTQLGIRSSISLFDTVNGDKIATGSGSVRQGGGISEPTGRFYYHGETNVSNASLKKFDTDGDTFTLLDSRRVTSAGSGSRLVEISGDGSRIFWNGGVFDPNLNVLMQLNEEVVASTYRGEVLFTKTRAINGSNGEVLATLPVDTKIQVVSKDQRKLYLFKGGTITSVDISSIADVPPRRLVPGIADEAVVIGTSQELIWSQETAALSYDVYFGSSASAVAGATKDSPEFLGNVTGAIWTGALPDLELGGEYFWRIDLNGFSSATKGDVWSFQVAPVNVVPRRVELAIPSGAPVPRQTLQMTSATPLAWAASSASPWITVETPTGTTPGELRFDIATGGLAVGTHNGAIRLVADNTVFEVPVELSVVALNITLARADLESPRIYAVSEGAEPDQPAFLVVLDPDSGEILHTVPVGTSVTSMSVHYTDNRIYLTNWQEGLLRGIDRDSLEEVRTYQFRPRTGFGSNSGDAYVVAAGRAGRVVIEQQDQWINMFLIDTASGDKIATAPGSIRQGGGVFEPTGRFYYHGESNSSNAALKKFDTDGDIFTLLDSRRVTSAGSGSRLVEISGDGSRIFWNGGVFDPDLNVLMQLNEEVVSSTYRGELLFTNTKAINGSSSEALATLPVNTKVQAVSGDQRKLFLFKGDTITTVDLATIAEVPQRGLVPGIADEAVVIGTDQELTWSQEAAALSYDVYFGSSASAVAGATKDSPEFLGNVTGAIWTGALPDLELGGEYFWRIDLNGFSSATKGDVWSFQVAPVNVVPRRVELAVPTGSPVPRQTLEMTSVAPLAWTATSSTPWITVVNSSGTTPDTLHFDISTIGMSVGSHSGSITVQADGLLFAVPVKLSVVTLNVTQLVAHPERPVVYAINTALSGEGFSHLLELDAATAAIRRTLPIGFAPTDAALDAVAGKLYVTNWGYSQTRVIDVDAWVELPPLNLGTDIFKIEATPDGRLITEGQDQWIQLNMWEAASGKNLASSSNPSFSVRAGDGQADPTGNYYYRCDSNSSGARVRKYDIRENTFEEAITGPQIGYGSRNLILSADGSRLFWLGRVLGEDLTPLGQMPAEVHATNLTGDLAVGPTAVWWSDSGTEVTTLAFPSTVAAFSSDDSHLLRFDDTTRTLHSIPVSSLTDLPGPSPRPGQVLAESPERISWTPVAGATSYRVFIAADADALQAMTAPTATVGMAEYEPPAPLAFGRNFSWRVDAVTASGVVTGATHEFGIEFPAGPALSQIGTSSTGIAVSLADRHLLVGINGSAQLYEFDPADGKTSPIQRFTLPGHYTNHYFGAAVAMDAGKAAVGAYQESSAYLFRSDPFGFWQRTGPLTPPNAVSGERFGRGLAASGNVMLVGSFGSSSTIGRVCAYVTEPEVTLIQTFSADDGVVNDGFGQVIAIEGNVAVISAPGRGPSYNRQPSLYVFERSTTTGMWSQTQKIAIPGTSTSGNPGRALALSGNLLATNTGNSAVILFRRSRAGWVEMATINRSEIPNSSTSFGSSLALVGEQLFIGDPSATYRGTSGGAVFSFLRSGDSWLPSPVIAPAGNRTKFGTALAVHDRWLAVAGGNSQQAWLFRISDTANRRPSFTNPIPTQVVADREFSIPVRVEDPDGNDGLTISEVQAPLWLQVTDQGNGQAMLQGTAPLGVGQTRTVQLRARDTAGAEAFYTFELTVLDPTDLPQFIESPSGDLELGVGQELSLQAAVSGTGPFQWQWWRNGEPIPGATGSTLVISEVGMENAGTYQVRVRNVVGEVVSDEIEVTVRPANRFAGDWPTLGSSPAHTGRHPAALDSTWFRPAWEAALHGHPIHQVAVADGRAVAIPQTYFVNGTEVHAVDLETGSSLWTYPMPPSFSSNPPTLFDSSVYFQRGKGTGGGDQPELIRLNAADGALVWKVPFGAQWERYKAPAVSERGIFINGGTFGGMYGFGHDGTEHFFQGLPQTDNWAPTLAGDRLFTWIEGTFTEHNPNDGGALWNLLIGGTGPGYPGMNTVAAIAGNSAAVIGREHLTCIDLASRSIRWQVAARHLGSPAIGDRRVFAILGDAVMSHALADGTPGPVYSTGGHALISEQPIIFNDRLAVSSASMTWVFDLASGELHQTLAAGGRLSYSNGYLLAAGDDGTLRAFLATPHGRVALGGPDGAPIASEGPPLRLGSPPAGSASANPLTLSNSGLADLGALEWRFEGEHSADFEVSNAPATTLAAGATTPLVITHTPSAKGRREAVLVLASDDPSLPEFRVPLFALPPVVALFAASDITGTGATLHGTVAAMGNDVEIVFDYGTTPEFGTTVSAAPAAMSGEEEGEVSAPVAGLSPGTVHHYRLGATHAHGTHWSEGSTFTTLSDNARLSGITSRIFMGAPFEPDTLDYFGTLGPDWESVELRPRTEHPGATVEVNGEPLTAGVSQPVPLTVGNNPITIEVTAEDRVTTRTYTIVVTRLPEEFAIDGSGAAPVSAGGFRAVGDVPTIRLDFHPPTGRSITLVDNSSLLPISGGFTNLAHGQRITLSFEGVDYGFVANYFGGDGNDLVLHWADTAVYGWGLNSHGQLGDGATDNRSEMVPTVAADGPLDGATVLDLAAGYLHSLALLSDGTVAAWGYGPQGQLGHGGHDTTHTPVAVRTDGALEGKTVVALAAGAFHNLALCADGTLVAWGYNNHGQLGDGSTSASAVPVPVRADGALAGKRVVAIAAGSYHSLALCSDGTVAAWGYNDEGELGDGTTTRRTEPVMVDATGPLAGRQVAAIRAGQYHALALCTDGTLVSWGFNGRGQLGDGTTTDRHTPADITASGALAGKTVVSLAAGGMHSLARADDGSLLAWGGNRYGELGPGHPVQVNEPVSAGTAGGRIDGGAFHSLAPDAASGGVTAWGRNHQGQLGRGTISPDGSPAPAETGSLPDASRLIHASTGATASHNLAVVALPVSGRPDDRSRAIIDGDSEHLLRSAFGLSVGESARLPRPVIEDGRMVLRFGRDGIAEGYRIGAEWSPDLTPGSWRDLPDTGGDSTHEFSLRLADHPAAFIRLRVEARE